MHLTLLINFLVLMVIPLSSCNDKSSSPSNAPSVVTEKTSGTESSTGTKAAGDFVISGQIAVDTAPAASVGGGINVVGREVSIKDAEGGVIAKAYTGANGQYKAIVPGTLAVDPSAQAPTLKLSAPSLHIESVISDTADQSVLGIRQDLDMSKATGRVLALDKTQLTMITAIRGQAILDGAGDHTGISVYIPGTSYAARTDSAGMFLMTFLAPGTYDLHFEKDGYTAVARSKIEVHENDTAKMGKTTLKLSGGATSFSVKQIGTAGISASRHVEWQISAGSADRFKGGLDADLEVKAYGPVPQSFVYDFADDGIFTIKMVFANADGFEQAVTRTIVVDTTKPKPDGLVLTDRKTLNPHYSNERFVMAYHPDCKDIDTVAILPASAGRPNDADFLYPCLSTAAPNRVVFTIPSDSASFDYKIWARDLVGNVSDTYATGKIILDTVAPNAPTVTFSDQTSGSTLGTDITTVNVTISTCSDIEYILISESQLLQPDASKFSQKCNANPNSNTFTFANNIPGLKTALVWSMDYAGNISQISSNASITLDQTPPIAPSFSLADPTPATSGYSNDLTLIATPANCNDTTHVLIAEGQITRPEENNSSWLPCSTAGVVTHGLGAGTRTLHLWARDIGGNISLTSTTASIIIDLTPPVAPSFTLADSTNNSALATNAQVVKINISSCTDIDKVAFTTTNTQPAFSTFTATCQTSGLTYDFGNTTNGSKILYLWGRDLAGNISVAPSSYSITMDTVPPSLPSSFALADSSTGSPGITNSTSFGFTIDSCPSGEYLYISEGQNTAPDENSINWMPCATSGTATNAISGYDGTKIVYLWKKDEAGNINGYVTANILMDTVAPNAPTITSPASNPSYLQTSTVTVSGTTEANAVITITGGAATVTTIADASGNWSRLVNLNTNSYNSLSITATDAPGNVSNPSYLGVIHDTIAPTISNVRTLLTDTTLDLSWDTINDDSVYTIDWGTTSSYGETPLTSASYSTSHTASLTGLTEATTYYYRIRVTDRAGNTSTSNDYTSSIKTYRLKTGSISSETWSDTTTAYLVSSNLTVPSGSTLTISPGVSIRMAASRRIQVDGTLVARGLANNPITITANSLAPSNGYWDSVQFGSTSVAPTFSSGTYVSGNILEYVNLSYGGNSNHMVRASGGGVLVKNCNLSNAGNSINYKAAAGLSVGASLYIWDSTLSNNYIYGVYVDSGTSGGVFEIKNSTISFNGVGYNRTYPIAVYSNLTLDSILIANNIFSGYYGLNSSNPAAPITLEPGNSTTSTISNNRFYPSGSYVSGISCNGNCTIEKNILALPPYSQSAGITLKTLTSNQTITVQKNIIVNAQVGVYLSGGAGTSSTYNINNNTFAFNWLGYYCSFYGSAIGTYPYSPWNDNSITFSINRNLFYKNSGCGTGNGTVFALEFASKNYGWSFLNNNFVGNTTTYLIYTWKAQANGNITAANNYWQGATTNLAINSLLYDYDDNTNYAAISFTSPSATPYTNAPISPPEGLNVNYNGGGDFALSWTAKTESNVAGYKIYYKPTSGYPWNGTGATQGGSGFSVGNVTSATVSLPTGSYYFTVTAYDNSTSGVDDQVEGHESWHSSEVSAYGY